MSTKFSVDFVVGAYESLDRAYEQLAQAQSCWSQVEKEVEALVRRGAKITDRPHPMDRIRAVKLQHEKELMLEVEIESRSGSGEVWEHEEYILFPLRWIEDQEAGLAELEAEHNRRKESKVQAQRIEEVCRRGAQYGADYGFILSLVRDVREAK